MQFAHTGLLLALFVAVAASSDCTGNADLASLPYTVDYTTTGDATSTTFVFTVCSSSCPAANATCQPLSMLSIDATHSAVTTTPASALGDCGVDFTGAALGSLASTAPDTATTCEAFYLTAAKPGATLSDICGGSLCVYRIEVAGGASSTGAVMAAGGGDVAVSAPTTDGPAAGGPSPGDVLVEAPATGVLYGLASPDGPSPSPYGRRMRTAGAPEGFAVAGGAAFRSLKKATPYDRRLTVHSGPRLAADGGL